MIGQISFLSFAFLLLFWQSALAVERRSDMHIHAFFPDSGDTRQAEADALILFERNRLDMALILSPSYLVGDSGMDHWEASMELRGQFDRSTANLLSRFPGKALGLCGLSASWKDGDSVLKDCLALDGMSGVKIRFENSRLSDLENFTKIRHSLLNNATQVKVVLVHLGLEYTSVVHSPKSYTQSQAEELLKRDRQEIDHLLQLAKAMPKTQFIIGHGLSTWKLVDELTDARKSHGGINNIWLETSFSLNQFGTDYNVPVSKRVSWIETARAWKRFGEERILFGSDQVVGANKLVRSRFANGWRFEDQSKQILSNSHLGQDFIDKIMHSNSERLFDAISNR